MHPDLDRYVKACEYPGALDAEAVGRRLAEYLAALGVQRRVVRLERGWTLSQHPPLERHINEVLKEFAARDALDARAALNALDVRAALNARAARDARAALDAIDALDALDARAARAALNARDARDARAARAALDANAPRRFAAWCVQGWYYGWDLSWISATWIGANTESVRAWSGPIFEAFAAGAWLLFWTDEALYWAAKPTVHVERPAPGTRRLHREDGPALVSDVEDLWFWHGVLVPEKAVMRPAEIAAAEVAAEPNVEVRRVLVERMGPERYMREAGARVLDMDSLTLVGSAPRALMEDASGNRWLVGTDGSTKRVYLMAVPNDAKTCQEAHRGDLRVDAELLDAEGICPALPGARKPVRRPLQDARREALRRHHLEDGQAGGAQDLQEGRALTRPCPDCQLWFKLTSIVGFCPECDGTGTIAGPPGGNPIGGLVFVSTKKGPDQRILAGCPDPGCPKWIDITPFLKNKARPFKAACPDGHILVIKVGG